MPDHNKKILIIDGHSILNRAFYGLPDLTNYEGLHTNAVLGFLNIIFKIIDEEQPTNMCVAFDVKQPTFRHLMYKEYKGTRKPMPDELREQVPLIKEVLTAINIDAIKAREHEAVREMIYQSCLIKGGVVERDPKEKGERALLNFGHTLGHAIEKLKDFTWLHGECVAAGCCLAAEISCIKGNISKEEVDDIKGVFEAFDMNGDISELSADDIVKTTKSDKKMVGDKIKFVLLRSVGDAYIDMSVTDDEMKQVLQG